MSEFFNEQAVIDEVFLEKLADEMTGCCHIWCENEKLSAFLVANIHLLFDRKNLSKCHNHAFGWLNKCSMCLIAYYKLRENLTRRENEDILQGIDDKRLLKIVSSPDETDDIVFTEILVYNWKCLRIEKLRYGFLQKLRSFYKKDSLIFSKMSFSFILLIQLDEPEILSYLFKIFKHLKKQKLLYLHSGLEEWDFLLNCCSETNEKTPVFHSLIYKKNWLVSMVVYLTVESTFYTEEIVSLIVNIYNNTSDVIIKTICFRLVAVYLQRDHSMLEHFKSIFGSIFAITNDITKYDTDIILLKNIVVVLTEQFRHFCLIKCEDQFFAFFEKKCEYTAMALREIVLNCELINDFVAFIDKYSLFTDIMTGIFDKNEISEDEKNFVLISVDRTISGIHKSLRDKTFSSTQFYNIFLKWHNIAAKMKHGYHLLGHFLLLFSFDVERVFADLGNEDRLCDVYNALRRRILNVFANSENIQLSEELNMYLMLSRSDFSMFNVDSIVLSKDEEKAILCILQKNNAYYMQFRRYSPHFDRLLELLKRLSMVYLEIYVELFNFLWYGVKSGLILETLTILLPKIKTKTDARNTFLYHLDWVTFMERLEYDLRFQIETFIICFFSWCKINDISSSHEPTASGHGWSQRTGKWCLCFCASCF